MAWTIEWTDTARKALLKLDRTAQHHIVRYMREKIATKEDPKRFGKPLQADFKGLWRYRVGDYRIICRIEAHALIVLVVALGHRRDVYE